MTERLYYQDAYLKEADATVIGIDGDAVMLDRTIFYPEAGGQPGDRGMIGPFRVVDTRKGEDGTPLHIVPGDKPVIGSAYRISLDWEHRYFYMAEHSAQHLVSALLHSLYGIGTVAVHQGESFFTVETDCSHIDEDKLLSVEDAAARAIREGHRIYRREMSHGEAESLHMRRSIKVAGDVMVVFIDGIDAVACGGVHLSSLAEIGEIAYCAQERIRSHVRTIWKCSSSAVAARRQDAAIVSSLCALFSSEPGSLAAEARRTLDECTALRRSMRSILSRLAACEYREAGGSTEEGKAVIFSSDIDISAFEGAVPEDEGRTVLVVSGNRFMLHGSEEDFALFRSGLPSFRIRGGGRGTMFRGSFEGSADELIKEADPLL